MPKKRIQPVRLIIYMVVLVSLIIVCEHLWKKSQNQYMWKLWDPLSERVIKLPMKSKGVKYYEQIQLARSNGSPWPPESVFDLRDPKTGFFDMKIRPKTCSSAKPLYDIQKYARWLEQSALKIQWKGSKLRKMVYLDRVFRNDDKLDLFLYPLVTDLHATVRAVKAGMEVDMDAVNDPDLFVIKSPSTVCNPHSPKKYELIVIMKSCADCFKSRHQVRNEFGNLSHWSDFRLSVVFVVGLPSQDRFYDYLKFRHSIWERIMHPFYPKTNLPLIQNLGLRKLFWEYQKFGDLLIGSFIDTYENLNLKQLLMFRWASAFCRNQTRLFMFMDHDQTLIPKNTIPFIRQIPDSQASHLVGGVRAQITAPVRHAKIQNTKWTISFDRYPWPDYPPYPQGAIYLIGAQVLEDITIASLFTERFPFEDVYLGIVAHKLNVEVVNFYGFWLNMSRKIDWSTAITVRSYHLRRLYDWKRGEFK